MHLQPILAADLIQMIFGIIVFVIWIVGQILGSREQVKRKQRPQRPRQPRPVAPADQGIPGPRQGPRNQEDALRSEVEEFLRRAQGKPAEPKAAPQQQAPKTIAPPTRRPTESEQPRRKQPAQQARRPQQARTPQQGRPGSIRTEGVAEHVQRHISTDDIAEHTRTLGAEVASADDEVESRLHEKFDHSLGQLQRRETEVDRTAESVDESNDIATEVAEMLRKPEGMRQLIIANEILRRPNW